MSEVLDALGKVTLYSVLAWLVVMVGTSAALARRLGWNPTFGALAGLIPIPFAGWLVVWLAARHGGQLGVAPTRSSAPTTPSSSPNSFVGRRL